jgi:hypothetical protein
MTFQPGDTVTPQQAWRKPNETSARENWKGCGSRKQKLQPEYRSRSIRRNEASCELASHLHRETTGDEGDGEMRAARLQELGELLAMLLETARELPPGQDRHNALQEIARFRARIIGLQRQDLRSAHRKLKAKGK